MSVAIEQSIVKISTLYREILTLLGEDPEREGLKDTPMRVAMMLYEMTHGLRKDPPKMTLFDRGKNDQMVTVIDLDMNSLCEHHMLPFYGKAHIGYIPSEKLIGLSKFGRILDWHARRPQIQEQLTAQVADHLCEVLKPAGLIVVIEATHMCMSIRGIKKSGHLTTTSAIRGHIPKEEFFDILKVSRR